MLSLAVFFGAIVAWVTDHLPEGDWLTNEHRTVTTSRAPLSGQSQVATPVAVPGRRGRRLTLFIAARFRRAMISA